MFFSQYCVTTVARKGSGFVGIFVNDAPPIEKMGNIIGYANRAQLSAGRTRFEVVNAGGNKCNFRPKGNEVEIPPNTLYEHLIHFLIEVGFMPESMRPKLANPTAELLNFDPLAQAAA